MKKKAIICDLDNTLTDSKHRSYLVEGNPRQWDKFFELAKNDPINIWCLELINAMKKQDYEIIFVTGRPIHCMRDTIVWLKDKANYDVAIYFNLFMRKEGDRRKDHIIKEEIYEEFIKPHYEIIFAIDDKNNIVNMWKKHGIMGLYCGELKD